MMSTHNIIKAPAVDNLENIKNIIKSLEYAPIPYSYIDERHLEELEKNSKISLHMHENINNWKDSQGILKQKGFLQSVISLLRALNIISNVKIEKKKLNIPLGVSGPMLNTFLTRSTDAIMLTKTGYRLLDLLKINDSKSRNEYDDILFWRFLHSNITHNFQRLIEDINAYNSGVEQILKKFETDTRARSIFIGWINYFDLKGVNTDNTKKIILSKKKIIKKIISSTILEINTLKLEIYPIEKLSNHVSKQLDFSNTIVNFFMIFEIILTHIQTSNEHEKPIVGTSSSRDNITLPHFPKINMLKILGNIPTSPILKNISESEIDSVLNFGEKK